MTTSTVRDLPLSEKERAQWTLHRLAAGRPVCNVGFGIRTGRPLRWWPLKAALDQLAQRHAPLRSTVGWSGAAPCRRIAPAHSASVPLRVATTTAGELGETLVTLMEEPFDLDGGDPLIRADLVLVDGGSVVLVTAHHLVSDGSSVTVLIPELLRLYEAFAGEQPVPADLAGPAGTFVEPPPDEAALAYWLRHLDGFDPTRTALAGSRPPPARPTFAGARVEHVFDAPVRGAVARLRRHTHATDNVVLIAAFGALLAAHGAGPDLAVGVPIDARRGDTARHPTVGYHVNTLPMRVRVDWAESFTGLVRRVRDVFLAGLEHGSVSFEDIASRRGIRAADWRAPVFRHMINLHPVLSGEVTLFGEPVELLDPRPRTSRLDLELAVRMRAAAAYVTAVYSTEVHERDEVSALLGRYSALLLAAAADPDRPLGGLDAATAADRDLVTGVNATARAWPDATVVDAFTTQVRDRPDADAVRAGEDVVSYRALARHAEEVRLELAAAGVGAGDVVALHAARGPALAAAVFGVWATGAAYLPLDPGHPAQRLSWQIAAAGARVVLSDRPPPLGAPTVIRLDALAGTGPDGVDPAPPPVDPAAPAYVIYTSGSTGRPKGVGVSHASLHNVVRHFVADLGAGPDDRTLWSTTFSFDISALELLLPLASGGEVVVAPDDLRARPRDLLDLVEYADATILQATPTTWRTLAPHLDGRLRGRRVLCGGEPLPGALAQRLLADGCRLINVYGPTETTIWSTAADLTGADGGAPGEPGIGRPIANTTVCVRAPDGRPLLPGVPGELCVGGAGVALGYRDDEARTAERFVDDASAGRYYRTGDLVRLRGTGLEFLGRTDRQLKIRGVRIEPGEVESVLAEHPRVRAAVVVAVPDANGQPVLAAAVQPAVQPAGEPPTAAELRVHAAERLALQAVPARFVTVEEFPLTGNGKVDHRALAAILAAAVVTPVPTAPAPDGDPALRTLVGLWREVLGDGTAGEETNFFLAGGHSVLAGRLADRINAELGTDLALDAIFEAPTPVDLAEAITTGRPG